MTSITIKTLLWASSSALALGLTGCGGDNSFYDSANQGGGSVGGGTATIALSPAFQSNPNGTLVVSGSSDAGSVIRVTFPDGQIKEVSVDSGESYTLTSSLPQTSGPVRVVKLNTNGSELDSVTQTYTDVDAPLTPTGTETIEATGFMSVTGTAETGSTVKVTFPSGQVVEGLATNGTYTIRSLSPEATSKETPAPEGTIEISAFDRAGNFSEPLIIAVSLADPLAEQKVAFDNLIDSLEIEGKYVFGGYDATDAASKKGILDHGLDAFNEGALKLAIDAKQAFDSDRSQFSYRPNNCVLGDSDAIAVGCYVISGERIKNILGAEYDNWDFDVSKRDLTGLRMNATQLEQFFGTTHIYVLENANADKNLNDVWVSGSFSYPYVQSWDLNQVNQKRFVTLSTDNSTRQLDFIGGLNAEDVNFQSSGLSFSFDYSEAQASYTLSGRVAPAESAVTIVSRGTNLGTTTSDTNGNFSITFPYQDSLANNGFSVATSGSGITNSFSLGFNSAKGAYQIVGQTTPDTNLFLVETATSEILNESTAGTDGNFEYELTYSNSKGAFTAFKDPTSVGGQIYQMGEGISMDLALNDRVTTPSIEIISFALAQNIANNQSNRYFIGANGTKQLELFGFTSKFKQSVSASDTQFTGNLKLTAPDVFQFKSLNSGTFNYECTINDIRFFGSSINTNGVVTTEPTADLSGVDYSTGTLTFN